MLLIMFKCGTQRELGHPGLEQDYALCALPHCYRTLPGVLGVKCKQSAPYLVVTAPNRVA